MTPCDAPLGVIVVEADPAAAEATVLALEAAGAGPVRRTDALDEAVALARSGDFDAALVSPRVPDFRGVASARKLVEAARGLAVVLWVDETDERFALEAVTFGARDYVVKGREGPAELIVLLRAAAARQAAELRLHSRLRWAGLAHRAPADWFWESGPDSRFSWVSERFAAITGLAPSDVLGMRVWALDNLEPQADRWARARNDVAAGRPFDDVVCRYRDRLGRPRALKLSGRPAFGPERALRGYGGTAVDATVEVESSLRVAVAHERLMDTHDELQAFRERLHDDLQVAQMMQGELLPAAAVVDTLREAYGVRLMSHFETSAEMGGDVWGVRPLDERRFVLWMADFTGHGVAAAINTFRLHTLMQGMDVDPDEPGRFLGALNRCLVRLLPTGHYATMLYGVVDVVADRFRYAAASAPRPLVVDCAGGEGRGSLVPGDGRGLPLGVSEAAAYATREMAFGPGALLFLYSDALPEAGRERGRDLGKEGVARLVGEAVAARGAEVTVEAILAPFFAGVRRPLADDLTVVGCLRPG